MAAKISSGFEYRCYCPPNSLSRKLKKKSTEFPCLLSTTQEQVSAVRNSGHSGKQSASLRSLQCCRTDWNNARGCDQRINRNISRVDWDDAFLQNLDRVWKCNFKISKPLEWIICHSSTHQNVSFVFRRRAPKLQKATQLSYVAPTKNRAKALNQKTINSNHKFQTKLESNCIFASQLSQV
jgi:hypothetical protein